MDFIPPIVSYWVLATNEKLRDIAIDEFAPKFLRCSGLPIFKYCLNTKKFSRSQSVRFRTKL